MLQRTRRLQQHLDTWLRQRHCRYSGQSVFLLHLNWQPIPPPRRPYWQKPVEALQSGPTASVQQGMYRFHLG